MNELQVSLVDASRRPDSNLNLENVVQAARTLSDRLRNASEAVQAARVAADSAIAKGVEELNLRVSQVAYLNRRISNLSNQGKATAALVDKRQDLISQINAFVPVHEVPRKSEKVALFTTGGLALLDGTIPTQISFRPARHLIPQGDLSHNAGGHLIVNNEQLSDTQMKLFAGGSIHANFAVRDDLAPRVQHELDSFAIELHDLFSDPQTDPTLTENIPGLFLDGENRASIDNLSGLSLRLKLNPKIDPAAGGDSWKIRDGLNAENEGPTGNPELLVKLSNIFSVSNSPIFGSAFKGDASLNGRLAEIEAHITSDRLAFEKDYVSKNSAVDALSVGVWEDGVNTDAEIQKLITLGQSYAANARVVQAVDEMLDQILRW
ncbi:flagellar basal body rod C-terminal domain-containing protein [Paracoccus onubensis]|uniref:FlgK family flagellar hook-associated protein n=1 Tax=Paracoccus onubensis TaxID=1675788 RepID=UPI00272F77FB|nr:flagellar basal body rod C-terminal domain-containing protein [Paracoccus onubensis]MDP0929614.1 flagellar basal body rod C-terminal domain-containing protein [Paracoccus onubensis]